MTAAPGPPTAVSPIRIAIFGNSNSLLRTSYARRLAELPEFEIRNFSLGGAPNASLLYSATQSGTEAFDYIIVEPAVTDADWIRNGYYDLGLMDRNFRRFVAVARARWTAPLILLVLPTIPAIELDQMQVRAYYRARALEFGITLIDFYSVYERMFGEPGLRDVFFDDSLHLSPFLFGALADLLRTMICGFANVRAGGGVDRRDGVDRREPGTTCTLAPPVSAGAAPLPVVRRATRLTAQTLVRMGRGDAVRFSTADDSLLSSLVMNRQATSAIVAITADPDGQPLYKDLRLMRDPSSKFMLHVAPLMREMHGRRFRLTVCGAEDAERPELEASSFQDRARCLNIVELCGAVLVREHAGDQPSAAPALSETAPLCMVWPALPGADAAVLETQLRDAIEPAKYVLRDMIAHNTLIPKHKADRVLRELMLRFEKAESWSAGEVCRELGGAFLKMGYLSAAELMLRRAHRSQPAGRRIRALLEQVKAETKRHTPPG